MRIRIEVKKKHILKGKTGDHRFCPIALAIKELGYRGVTVNCKRIAFSNHDGHYEVSDTPKKADRFIEKFDGGENVKPFVFWVEL